MARTFFLWILVWRYDSRRYADVNCRLKLKRPQTVKKYRKILDRLYAEVGAEEAEGARLSSRRAAKL